MKQAEHDTECLDCAPLADPIEHLTRQISRSTGQSMAPQHEPRAAQDSCSIGSCSFESETLETDDAALLTLGQQQQQQQPNEQTADKQSCSTCEDSVEMHVHESTEPRSLHETSSEHAAAPHALPKFRLRPRSLFAGVTSAINGSFGKAASKKAPMLQDGGKAEAAHAYTRLPRMRFASYDISCAAACCLCTVLQAS